MCKGNIGLSEKWNPITTTQVPKSCMTRRDENREEKSKEKKIVGYELNLLLFDKFVHFGSFFDEKSFCQENQISFF